MLDNEKIKALRATAAIIEQLGWLVNENPAIKLNDLGSDLRKALTHFEPVELPNHIEKSQLIQVLYEQLNAWKKTLKRNFKTPIANFAEETSITTLKAATLKKKDDPISIIVAQAFDEKINLSLLKSAVNQLQEMGFVVQIKKEAPAEKSKNRKNISDDPLDILLNG